MVKFQNVPEAFKYLLNIEKAKRNNTVVYIDKSIYSYYNQSVSSKNFTTNISKNSAINTSTNLAINTSKDPVTNIVSDKTSMKSKRGRKPKKLMKENNEKNIKDTNIIDTDTDTSIDTNVNVNVNTMSINTNNDTNNDTSTCADINTNINIANIDAVDTNITMANTDTDITDTDIADADIVDANMTDVDSDIYNQYELNNIKAQLNTQNLLKFNDTQFDLIDQFPFKGLRPVQQYIVDQLKTMSDKKFILLEAMPGTGKSAIAKMIASHFNSAYILTATKQLQEQYLKEFKDLVVIKGKGNYYCTEAKKEGKRIQCNYANCVFNPKIKNNCIQTCEYEINKKRALQANIVVTSYALLFTWLTGSAYKPKQVLICDECHLLINMLINWAEVKLNITQLQKDYNILYSDNLSDKLNNTLILTTNTFEDGYNLQNQKFINTIYTILQYHQARVTEIINKFKDISKASNKRSIVNDIIETLHWNINKRSWSEFLRLKDNLTQLISKLEYFLQSDDKNNWVIAKNIAANKEKELVMKPLTVDNLFRMYMEKFGIQHIIFMSATILNPRLYYEELGISSSEIGIIRADSTFDVTKSPIYYYPVSEMTYKFNKNEEQFNVLINKLAKAIKLILKKYNTEKGVIHTGTYQIARALYKRLNDPRLTIKLDFENNSTLLRKHSQKANSVLISPSLGTGTDLKDDLSRFQIIIKLPFLSLGDKRIAIKSKQNYNWYICEMFKNLIQMSGRSTRSEDDYSATYILDVNFKRWVLDYQQLLPDSFNKRIIWNIPKNHFTTDINFADIINADTNASTDKNTNINADINVNTVTDIDANTVTDIHTNMNAHVNTNDNDNANANVDINSNIITSANISANTSTNVNTNTNTNTSINTDTNVDANINIDNYTDTNMGNYILSDEFLQKNNIRVIHPVKKTFDIDDF